MPEHSVFVVEDDAIIALSNIELLTKSGYAVPGVFAYGEDLLYHISAGNLPDLILMDIGLAGKIDGLETARRVRDMYSIPFIFLSSNPDHLRRARAEALPPSRYLSKPVFEKQLLEAIGEMLRKAGRPGLDR